LSLTLPGRAQDPRRAAGPADEKQRRGYLDIGTLTKTRTAGDYQSLTDEAAARSHLATHPAARDDRPP
jgi:hypothetical protein